MMKKLLSLLLLMTNIIIIIICNNNNKNDQSSSSSSEWLEKNMAGKLLPQWLNLSLVSNNIKSLQMKILELELSQCVEHLFEHPLFIEHCKMIARWSINQFRCTIMVGLNCRLAVYYLDRYDNNETYHRFLLNFTSTTNYHLMDDHNDDDDDDDSKSGGGGLTKKIRKNLNVISEKFTQIAPAFLDD